MGSIRKAALVLGASGALLFGAAGVASADSNAYGAANNSPGVLSGNVVQIPIDVPINLCGNSVNVIGLANPAFGNTCVNGSGENGENEHSWHAGHWGHHFFGNDENGEHSEHGDNGDDCN
ncbi:chaplin [Streptacidiphilus carbonis]|uniref:chaplin n=1 Tax=Streptacidiphilus carbonis TaxID=105422 RepID=UPI0005A73AB0|nr:chaplin [Streptacidiphilus carbonis]